MHLWQALRKQRWACHLEGSLVPSFCLFSRVPSWPSVWQTRLLLVETRIILYCSTSTPAPTMWERSPRSKHWSPVAGWKGKCWKGNYWTPGNDHITVLLFFLFLFLKSVSLAQAVLKLLTIPLPPSPKKCNCRCEPPPLALDFLGFSFSGFLVFKPEASWEPYVPWVCELFVLSTELPAEDRNSPLSRCTAFLPPGKDLFLWRQLCNGNP